MIVKSRVTGEWALEVFESFRADTMLPKFHRPKHPVQDGFVQQKQGVSSIDPVESSDDVLVSVPSPWVGNLSVSGSFEKSPTGIRRRMLSVVERMLGLKAKPVQPPSGNEDPLRILLNAKASLSDVRDCLDRMRAYDDAIRQAALGGQTARAERLMLARKVVHYESVLRAAGFSKFLSEAQAIEFASKCQKGLRLDWAANFGRPFPAEAVARKVSADALKVFDNYAVMHYDPKAKAFTLTAAQEAAKRDPILFGLIEGARKLYFIADWKDDECDLTMEEVAKVLGNASSEINPDPTVEP